MHITTETTSAILRFYNAGEQPYGTPFDMVMFIKGDEGVATIAGLKDDSFNLTFEGREALKASLRRMGFHTMRWVRYRPGKPRREVCFSTDAFQGNAEVTVPDGMIQVS